MSTDYQLIIEQQDIIKNTLDRKQEVYTYHMVNLTCNYLWRYSAWKEKSHYFNLLQTLPAMQHQVKELEDKYKDIAQLKNMKEQVEDLKKERVWAEVFETEKVHCSQNYRITMSQKFQDQIPIVLVSHNWCNPWKVCSMQLFHSC